MEHTAVPIFKACEMAGVPQSTMFEWIATGRVEFVRSRGGSMLIVLDTIPPALSNAEGRASNRHRRSTSTKSRSRR